MSASTSHDPTHLVENAPSAPVYTLLASRNTWGPCPIVEVTLQGANQALAIPVAFLERSCDNTWGLVQHMISSTVNEAGAIYGTGTAGATENAVTPVDLQAVPTAGKYQFLPLDDTPFTWACGPQGAIKGRVVIEGKVHRSSSSMDDSIQDRFEFDAGVRDARCLLSRDVTAQATHIVPEARNDIYQELLQDPYIDFIANRSMGLYLNANLSKHYNMYDWSLYYKNGTYFVQVFKNKALVKYHGMAIGPDRFSRRIPADERPDPILCNWHYSQCCLIHLRGFSAGVNA